MAQEPDVREEAEVARAQVHRPMMEIPTDPNFPDIYADSINLHLGVYGLSLVLGRTKGPLSNASSSPVAVVRMSTELALVMTQLLRKNLRQFQEELGTINIPDNLLAALDIDKEL